MQKALFFIILVCTSSSPECADAPRRRQPSVQKGQDFKKA